MDPKIENILAATKKRRYNNTFDNTLWAKDDVDIEDKMKELLDYDFESIIDKCDHLSQSDMKTNWITLSVSTVESNCKRIDKYINNIKVKCEENIKVMKEIQELPDDSLYIKRLPKTSKLDNLGRFADCYNQYMDKCKIVFDKCSDEISELSKDFANLSSTMDTIHQSIVGGTKTIKKEYPNVEKFVAYNTYAETRERLEKLAKEFNELKFKSQDAQCNLADTLL